MKLTDEDVEEIFSRLDGECWSCHNNPGFTPAIPGEDNTCGICRGRGRVLTDAGHQLREFLHRWGYEPAS